MFFLFSCLFFFNDTPPTEIYTLSLHDALPICSRTRLPRGRCPWPKRSPGEWAGSVARFPNWHRSEEHTSELQSHHDLVCRLLLEKKNNTLFHLINLFYLYTLLSNISLYHNRSH